ncbi:hypothetical protein ACDF64_05220 [Agromyces sp. MMS24-JH15]|uniref:hypothetical protein n=1 Tax=Agromyces sp. MMS24-JH15 TaxID=3243765 RepID=UPI0037482608
MTRTDEPEPAPDTGAKTTRSAKRALAWIGGVLAAAVAAALTAFLVPRFTGLLDTVTTTGEPVVVRVHVEEMFEDVSLPAGAELSPDDLDRLAGMTPVEQTTWLEAQAHGVVTGTRLITMTLRGNRPHLVRITGVHAERSCAATDRGTLVRIAPGRGDAPPSEHMYIALSDPEGVARQAASGPDGPAEPYFPNRTITLEQGEEEVVVVELSPDYHAPETCDVEFILSIDDQDERVEQRVDHGGQPFRVMAPEQREAEGAYGRVLLAGYVCLHAVEAPAGWESDVLAACGPGNRAQ